MVDIYDMLFYENYDYNLFFLIVGALAIEFYILYKTKFANKKYIILVLSVFFGVAMLFRYSTFAKEGEYSTIAHSHNTGCLIENYKEQYPEEYEATILRYFHYFEGKKIEFFADAESGLGIYDGFDEWLPRIYMTVLDENAGEISEKDMEIVRGETQHLKKDGRLFLIDKTWKDSDTIVCINVSNQIYFLSKELYSDIISGDYEKDLLSKKEQKVDNILYMNRLRGERDINQFALLFVVFFFGWTISYLSLKGKNILLSAFLAFPVGVSLFCTIGIIYLLLGIPFRKAVLLATFGILVIASVLFLYKYKESIDKAAVLKIMSVAALIDAAIVFLKIFKIAPDSCSKMMWGIQIGEYGLTQKEALMAKEIGMLEPIMHAIGWKFHIDFVYGMYPIMTMCSIGIVLSAIWYFSETRSTFRDLLCMCAVLFLVTNNDYNFNTFWIMSNGTVGTLLTSIFILFLLKLRDDLPIELPLALAVMSVAITRVEGTCYLCLFFALVCGIKKYNKSYWYINIVGSVVILIWQIGLFIYGTDNHIFWNRKQGVLLVVGAIIIAILPLILRIECKLIQWILRYYYWITSILFAVISLGIYIVDPLNLSKNALKIMLRHVTTSDLSNSGALCCFVLLLLPLVFVKKTKETGFFVALIIEYLLMTYLIFCFRTGNPIHVGIGDSCRRIIQQLMPTVIFTVCYLIGQNEKEIDLENV